jgi:hypothetical protein
MLNTSVKAYINNTSETKKITTQNELTINVNDISEVYANSKIVSSAIITGDGGVSILNENKDLVIDADFETSDGVNSIKYGDRVRVAGDYANGGHQNGVYIYMGAQDTIDLSQQDYTNKDYWKEIPETQLIPEGYNLTDSDSVAIGGMVVRNDVRTDVQSFINNAEIVASYATITAHESAKIHATADSTAESSGGSAYGSGTSIAANGIIATNLILSKANAYITGSLITTTTADLTIDAQNTSIIEATTKSVTTSGDKTVGASLAFNTIGWEAQNLLFQAIDAIIGTDIGDEKPAEVKAYIQDSNVTIAGNVSLNAESKAEITSNVTNDATSSASALVNASGMAVSGILASNMVSSLAQAYIESTDTKAQVNVTGNITINSKDESDIIATNIMKAISTTTNDGGASIAAGLFNAVFDEYDYTSKSGTQTLSKNDKVRIASDHEGDAVKEGLYIFIGEEDEELDLTKEDYTNRNNWRRFTSASASELIPNIGNISDSDSEAFGGIIVRNDLRSGVDSYINHAVVNAKGTVSLTADESATIIAFDSSTATSSGGSCYGTGKSNAIGGIIATNLVLSHANAYVANSDLTTTNASNVSIRARNDSLIDATVNSTVESGDKAVGLVLAFNTIGWDAQNLLLKAVDALIGTNLGNQDPSETNAYILDTNLNIAGDLTINADNSAIVNATVSNAADSQASALYGAGGSASSGLLSSNMVSSNAKAYIQFTSEQGIVQIAGKTDISALDNSGIYANAKIVSSSITTNDGGASIVQEQLSKRIDPDMMHKLTSPFSDDDLETGLDQFQIDFLSSDGTQTLKFGDRIRVTDDHSAGGNANSIYTYMGSESQVDLTNADYTNLDSWKEDLVTQLIPQGLNVSDSDSKAYGGMVVRNDVRSNVLSYIDKAILSTSALTVTSHETATIKSTIDATVTSSGGSSFGTGTSQAISGIIATNLVLSKSNAFITDGQITTTAGDLILDAQNTSSIEAINNSSTSTGDQGVGVSVAFNTIGWEAQNILFQTIDAIIGTDIGNEQPAQVKAYIKNSDLSIAGNLSLNATSKANLTASTTNATESKASALVNASGMAVSGVIASNMVSSTADAYISSVDNTIDVSGAITISSIDDASIVSTNLMKAISITKNDGGASLAKDLYSSLLDGYKYTSHSGEQAIRSGDIVRVASDHDAGGVKNAVYKYKGERYSSLSEYYQDEGTIIDLSKEDFSDDSKWTRITTTLSDVMPDIGNITSSDSQAFGGIVVRNDVRTAVNSYIHDSKITASGNITITADESATIISTDESIASSSGGSAFGEGKSLAVNGLIATNLILSSADAHITDSNITTTNSGSILVDARNTSEIDATIISATSSGDTAVGVTLAFNTIGWESQNILFRTIDALIGTDIGDENPAETKAYIENTSIDANGDISVLAKNIAIINATITNAADSQASALFGASGKSASGMLASNMVSSGVNAAITSTDTRQTINANGGIIIVATDSAGIYSNTKVVSSSVTSNNFGMGIVAETLSDLTEVDFLSQDGAQDLSYGDKVLLADDYSNGGTAGRVYIYMGTDAVVNLSEADYSDIGYWKQDGLTEIIPEGLNFSDSDSMAIGGLVVRNDVRSFADASLSNAALTSDSLNIFATEDMIVKATADSTAESSGGSAFGSGQSLAVNAVIATNLILS